MAKSRLDFDYSKSENNQKHSQQKTQQGSARTNTLFQPPTPFQIPCLHVAILDVSLMMKAGVRWPHLSKTFVGTTITSGPACVLWLNDDMNCGSTSASKHPKKQRKTSA